MAAAVLAVPLFALLVISYQTPLYLLIDKTSGQIAQLFIYALSDSYPSTQIVGQMTWYPTASSSQQFATGHPASSGQPQTQGTLGAVIEKTVPVVCKEIAKIKAETKRDAALEAEQLLHEKKLVTLLPSLLAAKKSRHESAGCRHIPRLFNSRKCGKLPLGAGGQHCGMMA